ncbi:MAG: ATP-binding protein, partial [Bryobacteraceae bacterium]
ANIRLDLIVASDDPAVQFLLDRRKTLFAKVPIIFCGVNEYRGSSHYVQTEHARDPSIAGVLETLDLEETARMALHLRPGTKRIVTVGDAENIRSDEELMRAFPAIRARRLRAQNLTLEQIGRELGTLSGDSLVIFGPFSQDAAGRQLTIEESTRFVCERSSAPVFALSRNTLGLGVIGGKLSDGYQQGIAAGRMASAALNGKSVGGLGIQREGANPYMFDYQQLRRWHIRESTLPAGSIVVGKPQSFYAQNKAWIWAGAAFLGGQSLVIALLLLNRARLVRVQRELEDSKRLRDLALAAGRMGVWRWDAASKSATWSPTQEALFGFTPGTYGGSDGAFLQQLHTEDRERVRQAVAESLQTGRDYEEQYRVVWPDGTQKWLRAQGRVLRRPDGTNEAITGVTWDVTSRQEAEQALQQAHQELEHRVRERTATLNTEREVFRAVLDNVESGIVACDADGVLTLFNRATRDFHGLPQESLAADQWAQRYDLYHPDGKTLMRTEDVPLFRALREGEIRDVELVIAPKGREAKTLIASGRAIRDAEGHVLGAVVAMHDITTRKRVEEQVRALNAELELRVEARTQELIRSNAELRRANAKLRQFAYACAHDLQEPLRNIAVFTELLGRAYRHQLEVEALEFINFAVEGAQRMHGMVKGLLALTQALESPAGPFPPVDGNIVLSRAIGELQHSIEQRRAKITHDRLPEVPMNQAHLFQIFRHLLDNAVRHCGIEQPQVHVFAEKSGADWCLCVRDNGVGIDPKHAEYVFGVFKRLDRDGHSGIGIGLAIARTIVEHYGGRIWVESEPGLGAEFRFTVPAQQTCVTT